LLVVLGWVERKKKKMKEGGGGEIGEK